MNVKKKSIYNVLSGLLGQIAIAVIGLLIPRLVMVNFGSEVNGLVNSVTQIFQYVGLLEAGVGLTTLQALYKPIALDDKEKINGYLSATNQYYQKAGVIYFIIVILLALSYPKLVHSSVMPKTITAVIFFMGLNGAVNFFLSGKYKLLLEADGKKYVVINIGTVFSILSNLVKVILLLIGFDIVAVQGSFCLINIAQAFAINYYTRKCYKWVDLKAKPDFSGIKQRYSALIHQVSGLIFGSTDVIILTLFCDLKVVSVYTTYSMITNLVSNLVGQIGNGFTFRLGQLYQVDKERFLRLNRIYEIINLTIVFICYTVVYILFIPFIKLYTAGIKDMNYLDYRLPALFVIVQVLSNGRAVMGNVINYAGHFKDTQYRSVIESVINLLVSLLLVPYLGIYGVLIGTIVALFYRTNDIIIYASRRILHIGLWQTYRGWLVDLLIGGVIISVVNMLNISLNNYGQLLVYGMVLGAVVTVIYVASLFIRDYGSLKEFINLLLKKKDV